MFDDHDESPPRNPPSAHENWSCAAALIGVAAVVGWVIVQLFGK